MSDPTEAEKAAQEAVDEIWKIRPTNREEGTEIILRHMQPVIDAARARDGILSDEVRGDAPCSGCGTRENIVWFTDNTLWNMTIREPGGPYEGNEPILCISCFVMAVHRRGLKPTGWRLLPEWPIRSLHSPTHGASPATERVPRDVAPSPGEIGALQSAEAEGCKPTQDDKAAAEKWLSGQFNPNQYFVNDVNSLSVVFALKRAEGRRERDEEAVLDAARAASNTIRLEHDLRMSAEAALAEAQAGETMWRASAEKTVEERAEAKAALERVLALAENMDHEWGDCRMLGEPRPADCLRCKIEEAIRHG